MKETVWSIAMELVSKVYELTEDKNLCDEYNDRLKQAYRFESEQSEQTRNNELKYFCGRDTFFPYEA